MFSAIARWAWDRKILIFILVFAFVIRFIGIGYGLPQQLVADEFLMVAVSLKMLDTGSWRPYFPEIFYHQPVTAYISVLGIGGYLVWQLLTGTFGSLAEMRDFYQVNSADLLIVVRFLSVLFGVGAVWLLYLIGRDLFNKRVGLLAAFFGAFEFLLVQLNHTGRVWSFAPFFVALALWASVKVLNRGETKDYIKAALASVLALATTLPGILTFIPTIVAGFYSHGRVRIAGTPRRGAEARFSYARFLLKNKKLWLAALVLFLGLAFAIYLNPRGLGAVLVRYGFQSDALSKFVFNAPQYDASHLIQEPWTERVFAPLVTLWNYMPVYFVLFLAGLWILWQKDRARFWFLSYFPAAYYLFIGPLYAFGDKVRTLTPLAIYCVLLAAYAIDWFADRQFFIKRRFLWVLAVILVSAYSITLSVLFDVKISRADTRLQAIDWIYNNLPENSRVMVFSSSDDTINQNRAVLEKIQEVLPDRLNTRQKFLLSADDAKYPRPNYFAMSLRKFPVSDMPEGFFKENKFKYYFRAGNSKQEIEGQFAEMKLLISFDPASGKEIDKNFADNVRNPAKVLFSVDYFGPIVEIYEVSFK